MTNTVRSILTDLKRRATYRYLNADVEYGLHRAQELDSDPFKIALALSQLSEEREPETHVRCDGLRAWLLAEFMRRRQVYLLSEDKELTAFQSIFGWAPRWRFGTGNYAPFDHTFYFRFRDRAKGYLLATHPYNPDREEWTEFGNKHGARIEFPADYPSWWAPMLGIECGRRWPSVLIVCTREQPITGFREFIRTQRVTRDHRGDFIGDAKGDRTLPNVKSWPELEVYLQQEKACSEAIQAAKKVWSEFERHR
jgi:hypothetical protein